MKREPGFSTSIFRPNDDAMYPMIVKAMPYMPSGWLGPAKRSCIRPIAQPVRHPLTGLRRATAKKMVTMNGRSMIGRKRTRTGMKIWISTATSGMKMTAGQLNSYTATWSREVRLPRNGMTRLLIAAAPRQAALLAVAGWRLATAPEPAWFASAQARRLGRSWGRSPAMQ